MVNPSIYFELHMKGSKTSELYISPHTVKDRCEKCWFQKMYIVNFYKAHRLTYLTC